MDSSNSERISRVRLTIPLEMLILLFLTDAHIIVYEIDDKEGTRNADFAELENSRWLIALCICGSSAQRGYQDI